MLSDSQIAAFKADGALVLRSYIPPDIVDSWLQQWWDQTAASRDDAASWPGEAPAAEWRVSPKLMDLPQVAALSTQLGGPGGFTTSFPFDGHMIPTWPAREPGAGLCGATCIRMAPGASRGSHPALAWPPGRGR